MGWVCSYKETSDGVGSVVTRKQRMGWVCSYKETSDGVGSVVTRKQMEWGL